MVKIGIIGGSGLDDPKIMEYSTEKDIETPYGKIHSPLTCGKIKGVDVVVLARHGKTHSVIPSRVDYKANIWALKQEGVTHILATTAVGSLREEIKPGNLVFPNQFIDFTKNRDSTFFTDKVVHTQMAEPYNKGLRDLLCKTSDELEFEYNRDVTLVAIEGPRFSTKAESKMFRLIGADIINMSGCPEVVLANEVGIPYQSIGMSTDYDCWKDENESVTWEMILRRMKDNSDKVKRLLLEVILKIK